MPHRKRRKGRRPTQVSVGLIHIARRGYGFVDTPDGEYFVLHGHIHGAMDGDLVEVVRLRALEQRRRDIAVQDWKLSREARGRDRERLGSVRRVLERAHTTLIGTLIEEDGLRVVRPYDERIDYDVFIDHQAINKPASDGDIVVVRITTYPSRLEAASGFIEEVVGREDQQGTNIEVIIREHDFETDFSAAALEEVEALAAGVLDERLNQTSDFCSGRSVSAPTAVLVEEPGRRDIRDRFIFTIDPADAKDFDDALSLDYLDGQMRLGVHIADVSAYVPWDSALDLNARRRATSVYLPDRVLPMLPPQLSDDLCSLRPGVDKLAFSVDMMMNNDGSVASCEFFSSIIHSSLRLTYDQAAAILESDDPVSGSPIQQKLQTLNRLAHALARRRRQRGAIDFESVEAKVELDANGVPMAVHLRSKTAATALVEEAMILANEQVAAFLLAHAATSLYRIHEAPLPDALEQLLPTLQEFGYAKQGAPQSSSDIQAILDASAGKPEHILVSQLLLRAMKRARYAAYWTEHFGLASRAYTHFTSPIRRYPDLMVHRLLKLVLASEPCHFSASNETYVGEDVSDQLAVMTPLLAQIAEHSSDQEREAEAAAREATALKLAEYLTSSIGERFWAGIVGLNSYGIYVREDSTTAEGFIDICDLPQGLQYQPERYRYHDPENGRSYRLGQALRVVLQEVEQRSMRLRFVIA